VLTAQDPPAEPQRMGRARMENGEREDNTLCEEGEIRKEARGHEQKMSRRPV